MRGEQRLDWDPIRGLAKRVLDRGEPLKLSDDTRSLLRGSARDVAISSEDTAATWPRRTWTATTSRSPSCDGDVCVNWRRPLRWPDSLGLAWLA